jgi:hypothetical protein
MWTTVTKTMELVDNSFLSAENLTAQTAAKQPASDKLVADQK